MERPALAENITDQSLEERFQNKLDPSNYVGISQCRLVSRTTGRLAVSLLPCADICYRKLLLLMVTFSLKRIL